MSHYQSRITKIINRTNVVIQTQGLISAVVQLENLQAVVGFRIVQNLAFNVLFQATWIGKSIWSIFLMERKIVPEHYTPNIILGRGTEATVFTIMWHKWLFHEQNEQATF